MGNKERTGKFDKVSSGKTGGQKSFSNLDKAQHVNFSDFVEYKNRTLCESGEKTVNGFEAEEFSEQGNTRNTERASKSSKTLDPSKDSGAWQFVQRNKRKKSEKQRHLKTYEDKIFTQSMNKLKSSERHAYQKNSQQPILNNTYARKSDFRVQSQRINSNRTEIKDHSDKNPKCFSSNVSGRVHENKCAENLYREKDLNITELKYKSIEKQSEDFVLSTEMPNKHSLESNKANSPLKHKGEIAKISQYTEISKQAETDSTFITGIKKQNLPENKKSELEQGNKLLHCDSLTLKDKSSCRTHFHEYLKDTRANEDKLNNIQDGNKFLDMRVNNEAKTNLKNEENVNDKEANVGHEYQSVAYRSRLNETVEKNIEQEYNYFGYDNGYFCRPITRYPVHTFIPNQTSEHFSGYSDSRTPSQQLNGELVNGSNPPELNFMNYQEQYNEVSLDNEQSVECAINDNLNSNDFVYHTENLDYAHCTQFVLPWIENGMVYYQYLPYYSPAHCSCYLRRVQ